jgi:hypothetical protein
MAMEGNYTHIVFITVILLKNNSRFTSQQSHWICMASCDIYGPPNFSEMPIGPTYKLLLQTVLSIAQLVQ